MGDAADYQNEVGESEWLRHLSGECDGPCPYCDEEENPWDYEKEP